MNKERLLILATFLETMVPPEQWDYSQVVGYDWKGAQDLSCGTVGCAIGWAASVPVLRKAGMHLAGGKSEYSDNDNGYWYLDPKLTFQNVEKVFQISHAEALYLFQPGSEDAGYSGLKHSATAAEVAKHIRRFVKRGGIPGEVVGYAVRMYGNQFQPDVWRAKQAAGERQTASPKPVKMTLEEATATAALTPYVKGDGGRKVVKIVRRKKK